MAGKQQTLPGTIAPLKAHQEAALDYAAKLYELEVKKEEVEKRREEMVRLMHKARVDRVVVRDEHNREHIFEIEAGNIKVKHRSYAVITTEDANNDLTQ